MNDFKNKTVFITGGSRGIGRAIALRLASEGANIAIAAKSSEPQAHLPGTIFTVAEEIEKAGGQALPLKVDIRFDDQVEAAIAKTVETFGGIDICINNASAISLTPTRLTEMKKFDLMHQVNVRATFLTSKTCIPHLKSGSNPHILNLSPPLNMDPRWFSPHLAYTMSKYGMSLCVLGMAMELKNMGIAVNAIWPKTTIATAAVSNILGGEELVKRSRKPEIVAEAAYHILRKDSKTFSGNFLIDEDVLREAGETDFDKYAIDPEAELAPDFFI